MKFMRRIWGRSTNSGPADDVEIVHDAGRVASPPPEPVVEGPPQDEARRAAVAELQERAAMLDSGAFVGTRPLPPLETIVPRPGERMRFGQLSDPGMVRSNNQDAILGMVVSSTTDDGLPDMGLFVVADGMGGHKEGERASAVTVKLVAGHIVDQILKPLLDSRLNEPDRMPLADVLRVAVQGANDAVNEKIPEGGTTVTVTVILGDLAYVAHVGDSRAYMITDEGIEQITRDHSLVQRLIELDQLTVEEAAEHPQRNVLYRAIGQSENLDVDVITRRLPPRGRLLLCSDGLWNMVAEQTIEDIARRHSDPQLACQELVDLANDRGGPDNISVILVQMPG
ncbi:MAG: PP2C family protein-serine/threonine phosphatase [Aggregatilineaceae bacterium]